MSAGCRCYGMPRESIRGEYHEQEMYDLYHGRGNSYVAQTELMLAGSGSYAGLYDSKVPGSPDLMVKERL